MKKTPAAWRAVHRVGHRLIEYGEGDDHPTVEANQTTTDDPTHARLPEDTAGQVSWAPGAQAEAEDASDDEAERRLPSWFRVVGREELTPERMSRAKRAFTTRRVPPEAMTSLLSGSRRPRSGDVALAVVRRLGHHTKLELSTGRRAQLHVGDEIVVVYGDRYAPDQFEAEIPTTIGRSDLVAAGGVTAQVISQSGNARRPTQLDVIGLIGGADGIALNLEDHALPVLPIPERRPRTLAVVGASMNSGKTTTAQHLLHGLHRAGRRPGSTKVTGTGAGGDYWVMLDAGSHCTLDFTDAGLASTYRVPLAVIEEKMSQLVAHLTEAGCSDIVIEVADGLFQHETARLLDSDAFAKTVDAIIFASSDAMAAFAGAERLRQLGLPLVAISGVITRSPLASREAETAARIPIVDRDILTDPRFATLLMQPDAGVELAAALARERGSAPDTIDLRTAAERNDHGLQR